MNTSALQKAFPSDVRHHISTPPQHANHTATLPSCAWRLNLLENFPRVSRSERPLDAETVQSHIFHREIANGVHASKSGFICHPMKHSQIQSVNYGAINYYLQTSMKYVHSLQKQVDPSMTVFHDQVRSERLSQSFFMQQEGERRQIGTAGSIADGGFKIKNVRFFPEDGKKSWSSRLFDRLISPTAPSSFSCLSRTRHVFITFCPSIIPSREKRDRHE